MANYSYLSDGTKLSATDGNGKGLVYRGPFVYRKSSGGSSLTLESAAYSGGRLTPDGALLYVTDYLGNVRAVVNGNDGALYKVSDYLTFGEESQVMIPGQGTTPSHQLATTVLPDGLTLRDGYTGQENQNLNFGTSYIDFGARQYSPALRRWMMPDPLSEKYYGTSPYAFCNNNPVRYADPDGLDLKDKVMGYVVGTLTNIIPGTGAVRDSYSPTDPSDYNIALRDVDLTMLAVGETLTKTGGTMAVGGGALAVSGVSVAVATAGTAAIVAGPATVVGAKMTATGVATAATGAMMMANTAANQGQGYERGKVNGDGTSSEYTFTQSKNGESHTVTTKIPEGYKKVKGFYPHGKPVFYNGKNYITPDRDGHNGGVWKMAKTKRDLLSRTARMGTYDSEFNRIGD